MKSYGDLFDSIVNIDNILLAIDKASKLKKNKKIVQYVLNNKEFIANKIHNQLVNNSWKPHSLHIAKEINDGIELKKRIIVCPDFIDELIVQHSIMNICSKLFKKKFYYYSCGSVPGKGQETARYYIGKVRNKYKYCVKLDIKKFFDNLRPSIVFREIRRVIRDRKVLRLFILILRNNKIHMPDGSIVKSGIPIGFYTSPWFANIALNRFDHYVKEVLKIPVYVRYMDDMFIMHTNKRKLRKAIIIINKLLENMHLKLKKYVIHKFRCVRFLCYTFKRDSIILHDKVFLRIRRSLKNIKRINPYTSRKVLSYSGRFKHINGYTAFNKYFTIPISKFRKCLSDYDKLTNKLSVAS